MLVNIANKIFVINKVDNIPDRHLPPFIILSPVSDFRPLINISELVSPLVNNLCVISKCDVVFVYADNTNRDAIND